MILTSLLIVCVVFVVVELGQLSLAEAADSSDKSPVTCGSAIKLKHKETGNNLHSHIVAWGSGSGQQSVTANPAQSDSGSLWIVKVGRYL